MFLGGQTAKLVRNKGSFLCIYFNFKGFFWELKKKLYYFLFFRFDLSIRKQFRHWAIK